jgi:hypothetical protein
MHCLLDTSAAAWLEAWRSCGSTPQPFDARTVDCWRLTCWLAGHLYRRLTRGTTKISKEGCTNHVAGAAVKVHDHTIELERPGLEVQLVSKPRYMEASLT